MRLLKNFSIGNYNLINFINLDEAESEIVRKYRNHDDVRCWMYQEHVISKKEHNNYIKNLVREKRNFNWLLKNKKGDHIGVVSLNKIDYANKNAYFGIYTDPFSKIPGAGSMLMDCLKKIAFDFAGLHTLRLEVIDSNRRAKKFYDKMGFKYEGRLKEFVLKHDEWIDVVVMGMVNHR